MYINMFKNEICSRNAFLTNDSEKYVRIKKNVRIFDNYNNVIRKLNNTQPNFFYLCKAPSGRRTKNENE